MMNVEDKYKVVIVDDERTAIDALRRELGAYQEFEINLLSEIRDEVLWDMKVVFYTSYDKYLLQALRESAFDFLLKPFETEDLKIVIERYRKAVASIPVAPSSSFASSVSALMPQQGMFMISTVTGFKLLRLEEIGYFEYLKDKRQWQVALFNQTRLNLIILQ